MAALSIAFEAPDNSAGANPFQSRPIDFGHLSRQTMGDKALETEVLEIFARQAHACLKEISCGVPDVVKAAAHRLCGAAGAVGAFRIATAAEKLEQAPEDGDLAAAAASAVIEVENFILKLCR